ncbi:MAG TPA: nucleotidyltransferase domain-containing protein, partial [Phaeodactylibacter sp.]|nr:nucleotidyltransferase domain-containing protein [Phaeodactylibacter sp.]
MNFESIPIQAIGNFFPQDKNGFILNDASLAKVPKHWLPVIEKIKNAYLKHLNKQVHSIYLRGSIARGVGVDYFSDVDVFALLRDVECRWEVASWQSSLEKKMQEEYPFVKEVEVMLSSYFKDFYKKNPRLAMVIKTQSLCIFGEDLNEEIPPFFPNEKMILHLTWLKDDVDDFLKKEKITKKEGQAMMKILLRSGFELVMEKEQKYTTDLYWCYQVFSKYFPKKEKEMRGILHLYLNPIEDV